MIRRIKRYLVLRWIREFSIDELEQLTMDRKLGQQFEAWFKELADKMIQVWF